MRHWKKKPWVDSEVRNWDYIADHLAPDATSADAGKVLTVGETGKPEWGEGGGSGGGVLVITLTGESITIADRVLYELDHSYNDVINAKFAVLFNDDQIRTLLYTIPPNIEYNDGTVVFYDENGILYSFSLEGALDGPLYLRLDY